MSEPEIVTLDLPFGRYDISVKHSYLKTRWVGHCAKMNLEISVNWSRVALLDVMRIEITRQHFHKLRQRPVLLKSVKRNRLLIDNNPHA